MIKHTEAPWNVAEREPLRLKGGCYVQVIFSLSDAKYRPARAQGETAAECQANAHLIAAAPELIEACRKALAFIDSQFHYADGKASPCYDMPARIALVAAIAKAEERTP